MLGAISKRYPIDNRRVYATGFSNGGVFMYVLWTAQPNLFAAFAPCSGLPPDGWHSTVPKPVFVVAGEADPIVKIANQRAMIEELRRLNGAMSPGTPTAGAPRSTNPTTAPPSRRSSTLAATFCPANAELIVKFFRGQELKSNSGCRLRILVNPVKSIF